jgi:hypothetical protein
MPGAQSNILATPDEIFFVHTIQTPTGWYAKYPPGWPLILAIGYLLHCVWLINPILGVTQLFLVWRLARPWGTTTQVLAVLIISSSAYMLISNVGFMSHAAEAVICLLAVGTLLKAVRGTSLRYVVITFVLVVAATQIRLYTGAVLAVFCSAIAFFEFSRQRALLLRVCVIVAAAGCLALGLFLFENWLYTGSALLSPYSVYRGGMNVDEFTLNPLEICREAHIWRWAVAETIRVTFPFMFLAAAYACWKETSYRRQLVYLSLLFPMLIIAYTADPAASGSFDGERFYFEGFCAISIVAARGIYLLASNWQVKRKALLTGLAVLIGLQIPSVAFTANDIKESLRLYRQAYDLAQTAPILPLVFLSTSPSHFSSKQVNWNDANWRQARTVYLNDPGANRRDEVACRFGRRSYRLIQFNENDNSMYKTDRTASCASSPDNQALNASPISGALARWPVHP